MKQRAVFLDRDGTINEDKDYLYKIEDFKYIKGTIEALHILQDLGFKLIIITNQSGIARGYYSENDYKILTSWMTQSLLSKGIHIDNVYYCPHHPNGSVEKYRRECECRKPNLGLFKNAINDYDLDVDRCYAIGDKIRDCSICNTTNCHGFLISNNENEEIIHDVKNGLRKNVEYANNLLEAATIIKNRETSLYF